MGEETTFPAEDGRQLKDDIQCLTGVRKNGGENGENHKVKYFASMYTVDLISTFKKWLFSIAFNKPTSVTTGLRSDYKLNV